MRVVLLRSRLFLGDFYSRDEVPLERAKFIAGAVLTLVAPALLFCAVSGELWPLYLMACNEALGTTLGLVMFRRARSGSPSCVPVSCVPDAPRGAGRATGLKRAA